VAAGIASHNGDPPWIAFGAVLIGLVLASAIQLLTGYFTETSRRPVKDIGDSSETGAATVVLPCQGLPVPTRIQSASPRPESTRRRTWPGSAGRLPPEHPKDQRSAADPTARQGRIAS
jgi:hypothetical protein